MQYLPQAKQIHHGQPPFEHLRPASVSPLLRLLGRPPAKNGGRLTLREGKPSETRPSLGDPPDIPGCGGDRGPPRREPSTWAARLHSRRGLPFTAPQAENKGTSVRHIAQETENQKLIQDALGRRGFLSACGSGGTGPTLNALPALYPQFTSPGGAPQPCSPTLIQEGLLC